MFQGIQCRLLKLSYSHHLKFEYWNKTLSEKLNVRILGAWFSDGYCTCLFEIERQHPYRCMIAGILFCLQLSMRQRLHGQACQEQLTIFHQLFDVETFGPA